MATRELADELKISPTAVQKFKDNPFEPNGELLIKCCVAAGIVLGVINDE